MHIVYVYDITENNCGLTPRFNDYMLVAPPDGVRCGSNDTKRKMCYLLTHFDGFLALTIIL